MPVDRMTANQNQQIGAESTAARGTVVPANKDLNALMFQLGAEFDSKVVGRGGRVHAAAVLPNKDWTSGKYSMPKGASFSESVYPLSGAFGPAVITTPAGGVAARQWFWDVPLVGPRNPVTSTVEYGDPQSRAHRASYVLPTSVGVKADRETVDVSGNVIAQAIADGITMTPTPTLLPIAALIGKHWTLYLDHAASQLGSTKLARAYNYDWGYDGLYGPHWPGDRSQTSWATHVDLVDPKAEVQFDVQADLQGMGGLPDLRAGVIIYLRWEAIGDLIDNLQTLTISGTPTGGSFTLTYKGQTTAAIAWNATNAAVASALQALSTIGPAGCTVSGGPGPGTPYVVSFTGPLANDTTLLTHADSFTGGTTPALAIAQTTIARRMTIDTALNLKDKIDLTDGNDVLEAKYIGHIIEDVNWNHACTVTLVNSLPAL